MKHKFGLISKATDNIVDDMDMTFSEDFSGKLNPKYWNYSLPCWNVYDKNQSCLYKQENCIIEDSKLKIIVKKESGKHDSWDGKGTYEYTTGSIHTNCANQYGIKGFSQRFGRMEMKAKASNRIGSWMAFWMLSHRDIPGKGAILPEIDIIENFGGEAKGQKNLDMQFTVHYGTDYNAPDRRSDYSYVKDMDFSDDYYIYALEWTDKKIKWYINNNLVKVSRFAKMEELDRPLYNMFLIIGNGVRPEFIKDMKEGDSYVAMTVDWVRVYQFINL